jgi:hypothetical protein
LWVGGGDGLEDGEGCGLGVSGCVYSTLYPTLSGDGTAGRGWGTRVGDGVGGEEGGEVVGEEAGAWLGWFRRTDFGDGSDGAEVGVEDEFFD